MLDFLILTGLAGCVFAGVNGWRGRNFILARLRFDDEYRLRCLAAFFALIALLLVALIWPSIMYVIWIVASIYLPYALLLHYRDWRAARDAELARLRDPLYLTGLALDRMQARDPYAPPSNTHGSARFAWLRHISRKCFRLFVDTPIAQQAVTSSDWYGYFLGNLSVPDLQEGDIRLPLRYAGDGHRAIIGPPGSGKFHSGLGALLLDSRTFSASAIVFDPKDAELTTKTVGYRLYGNQGALIDPYEMTGFPSFRYNPMDLLKTNDPDLVRKVEELREAVIIVSPGEKNGEFWDTMSRRAIDAMLTHVATWPFETDRTLMRVAEIFDTFIPTDVLVAMEMNEAGGGLVKRYAATVRQLTQGQNLSRWNDICLTVQKSLHWLNTPELRRSLEASDFDVVDLIYGEHPGTLYIALPEKARTNAMAWMRVVYASMIEQLKEVGSCPDRHVHIVLDEFANLGRLDRVKNDLATTRGRNWHYHVAVQSLAQLSDIYGQGWEQILGQCAVEQVLGCGDNFTAEYYSNAAGQETVGFKTWSSGTSNGTSSSWGNGKNSTSSNSGSSYNISENLHGRSLIEASALRSMAEGMQVVFCNGLPPAILHKPNVYKYAADLVAIAPRVYDQSTSPTLPAPDAQAA